MSAEPHYCPGCGVEQAAIPRYPWYFCNACLELAEDGAGRRLVFGNMSASGGLWVQRVGDPDPESGDTAYAVRCLIKGRPVLVMEARFGGVVAQPIPHSMQDAKWMDLTRR